MTTLYKTYCLVCGAQSDSDIDVDDVFDWNHEHGNEEHPGVLWRDLQFHLIKDGEEHTIKRTEVGGFKVGDVVSDHEFLMLDHSERVDERVINGFVIYGYQGILATFEDGQSAYLDHLDPVGGSFT